MGEFRLVTLFLLVLFMMIRFTSILVDKFLGAWKIFLSSTVYPYEIDVHG